MASVEERLAALEAAVVELREQQTDTHDVAEFRTELRAQTRLIQALHETQVEQGGRLTSIESRLSGLETDVSSGFASLGAGMARIVSMIEAITPDETT